MAAITGWATCMMDPMTRSEDSGCLDEVDLEEAHQAVLALAGGVPDLYLFTRPATIEFAEGLSGLGGSRAEAAHGQMRFTYDREVSLRHEALPSDLAAAAQDEQDGASANIDAAILQAILAERSDWRRDVLHLAVQRGLVEGLTLPQGWMPDFPNVPSHVLAFG